MINQSTIHVTTVMMDEIRRLEVHINRLQNDKKRIDLELFVKHGYDNYGGPERDFIPVVIDPNYVISLLLIKIVEIKEKIRELGIDPNG